MFIKMHAFMSTLSDGITKSVIPTLKKIVLKMFQGFNLRFG